ncbi:DegT/DnrJ/EryC1/StrS family aminotransferase [Oribacterium sp. oral taxon 102]|uniref:DegT/DnrJ/EryC1/StrS family aminotransferase n=1 Tax=Oribacterium sp. oral taxon 102 TaxID=671214 RepID=UPI0015BD7A31|nr:DegT/DnrJ/EryC1/StrS family aminotransferase [Oribacterium sp. oral taxon 102]NWO22354.1 DegT/DnrJ/EryC1/StrS family aminotransferase [Oribacterium sp. oral taxon 102]
MSGKTINVTRASLPPITEYEAMLQEIWDSAWLTNMGRYHETLRAELRRYMGVSDIELFVNGHSALELLLQALELKGEVITTPFSFASTTHAIVRNRLRPVFCDINERDYTLDVEKLEGLITERTAAILPVHVYGNICAVREIQEIADRHGLPVVYDAAHAFGEEYEGRGVGSYGDASMFSFHATKVFHSIEGGAVCCGAPRAALMRKLYELKNFGILGKEEVASVGANGKMNEFAAAMGLCNLRHIAEYIEKRRQIFECYLRLLGGVEGICLPVLNPRTKPNYAYMPVRFRGYRFTRDEIYRNLEREDIHARKYFYPCINDYACYRGEYDVRETPVAKVVSEEILTLPIYPDLEMADVERICRVILDGKA